MITSIRELNIDPVLTPEERQEVLNNSSKLITVCLALLAGTVSKFAVIHTPDKSQLWLSEGHGLYHGASLVVDNFESIGGQPQITKRAASYAFFPDIVINVDELLEYPLENTPAHEPSLQEIENLIEIFRLSGVNI